MNRRSQQQEDDMGEIADAMLNGEMCEGCGVWLERESDGMPGYCSAQCAQDRGADWWLEANGYSTVETKSRPKKLSKKRLSCTVPGCTARFKKEAHRADHLRDKHGLRRCAGRRSLNGG